MVTYGAQATDCYTEVTSLQDKFMSKYKQQSYMNTQMLKNLKM